MFQVLLTVLSAKGLAKADVFGKSDPFAVVLLNRREVGHTRTLFKTLDPCWSEPRETFPLRIVGNRDRCSVAVQLWDEDLGEMSGVNALWQNKWTRVLPQPTIVTRSHYFHRAGHEGL